MTVRLGTWLGIGLILAGSGFLVAAFGVMESLGVAKAPSQWVYGVAGLLAGRILLGGIGRSPVIVPTLLPPKID